MTWDPYVTSLPVSRARPPVPSLCPQPRAQLLPQLTAPPPHQSLCSFQTILALRLPHYSEQGSCSLFVSQGASPSSRPGGLMAPSFEGWSLCWGPSKPTPTWPSPSSDGHTAAQGQGGSMNLWVLLPQVTHPTTACADLPSGSFLCPKCSRPCRVGAVGTWDSQPHQAP